MKNYKYSILLPHLNEGYLIDIMLDSIYNKVKYDNFEILIADDGSNNLSDLDFVKVHPLKEKIKIYYFDSLGPAKLRDFLGKEAIGDILIFSDSHMYFQDDFLTKINKIFNEKKDIGILQTVVGDYSNKSINAEFLYFEELNGTAIWKKSKNQNNIIEIPFVIGNSTVVKKRIFTRICGYNNFMIGRGSEDMDFSMRAWLYGYKCFLIKDIKFVHHFRQSFSNYEIKRENILKNKLIFVYSCFQTKVYIEKFLKNLKLKYEDIFDDIHNNLLENKEFWLWIQIQKNNYKYDDKWYLKKFKQYFDFTKEKA